MNLKKLNLGLVALLLGFGLVITQSAFAPKTTDMYGKVHEDGDENKPFVWESLDGLSPYGLPGPLPNNSYRCTPGPSVTCTAEFDHEPIANEPEVSASTTGIFEFRR